MNSRPLSHFFLPLILLVVTGSLPAVGKDESVRVWHESIKGGYRFYAQTADLHPRSIQIEFTSLKNLRASVPTPFQTVIANEAGPVFLFDLEAIQFFSKNKFEYRFDFAPGDFRTAKHDDSYVYWLPFQHGTKHRVSQGYHGAFSHSDPGREFALDFSMPEGTPVHAARGGIVINVKTDSNRGGIDKSFEDDGNFVTILHSDGSIADYVHLQRGGAYVRTGQKVSAGDRLGLSGNTGRSSGPHLHFQVAVPTAAGKVRSLPTRFLNHRHQVVSIKEGEVHFATHPGKPAFKATLGSEIQNTSYENHRTGIPRENRVSTRSETIDGTVVLFLRNGYAEAKEVLLTLPTMENLKPSKTVPLSLKVEPQTERFAVLLKQNDPAKPFKYQTEWKYRNAR